MNNYEFVKSFCSNDGLKTWMSNPALIEIDGENKIVATDAHVMLISPSWFCDLPDREEEFKSISNLIKTIKSNMASNPITISLKQLVEVKEAVPLIDEYDESNVEKCETCQGYGDWNCECCGSDVICSNCNGMGQIWEAVKTGNKIPKPSAKLRFNKVFFQYGVFSRLLSACSFLNEDKVTWVSGKEDKGNLFLVGEHKLILMPTYTYEKDEIFFKFN